MNRLCALSSIAALCLSVSSYGQALDAALHPSTVSSGFIRPAVTSEGQSSGPFSRVSIGGGVSPLGVQMQVTTNINQHVNLRFAHNMFNYSTSFATSGVTVNAKLNLDSSLAAVDLYPFHSGFRLSAGALMLNQNKVTAAAPIAGGTSFTLNGDTFYSANANSTTGATPIDGTGSLLLNATTPAVTVTAGWGNTIPRRGHWSFPFEIGAAFTGPPAINANLTGWACYDQAQTMCTNLASTTDPIAIRVQNDLTAQIATWKKDLDPLKTYPIISFGIAYSGRVR